MARMRITGRSRVFAPDNVHLGMGVSGPSGATFFEILLVFKTIFIDVYKIRVGFIQDVCLMTMLYPFDISGIYIN
ncbi:Uncharacterised protein [Salmonella enterica]|nr:Uncharacterised protein [Salmonella enterica]